MKGSFKGHSQRAPPRALRRPEDENPGRSTWDFPRIRVPYFGVLIIRILLFRVLY